MCCDPQPRSGTVCGMPPPFVAGLDLSRQFYWQAVRPVVDVALPDLPHTAALIGPGSDVLGLDTERSTDHDWGPRLLLFLHPTDHAQHGQQLDQFLARQLPTSFAGYPTNFAPADARVQVMTATSGPVRHRVVITDLTNWFDGWLGFDPRRAVDLLDWLATPTQRLAEVTAGAVFHDGLDELNTARDRLRWYPHDVWLYILACQWQRIAQEEAFVARCTEVGDQIGAAVVTARIVRDIMRLHLLMHRRYPPYSKWLGSAVARLPDADTLTTPLAAALTTTGTVREDHLCQAYETAAAAHNQLELTNPIDPATRPFHDRPFRVLHADRFATELIARITDPHIAALPAIGAIDQFADNTDLLGRTDQCRAATRAALNITAP
jgi:hypothetical protein